MVVMSEEQYLAKQGVSDSASGYCLDKLRANRSLRTVRGRKRFEKECEQAEADYQRRRNEAKAEYKGLVEAGEIRPMTGIERSMLIAHGHEDLAATHAARRMLEKRGIDWRTGKRLEVCHE